MTRAVAARRSSIVYASVGILVGVLSYPLWWLTIGPLWGVLASIVVAMIVGAALFLRSDSMALNALGAREIEPGEAPRLENLLEALTVTHGFRAPSLHLVDDAAPNAFAVGRTPRHGAVAVTTGLLDGVGLVELEAVLAHELTRIRSGESAVNVAAATLAGPLAGFAPGLAASLASRLVDSDDIVAADLATTGITRYPPGLAGALDAIRGDGRVVATNPRAFRHLWFHAPEGAVTDAAFSIEDRIAVLHEL